MRRKRPKLTRADFTEYRGYFWRPATETSSRAIVYRPTGGVAFHTPVDGVEQAIDQDMALDEPAPRKMQSAGELLRRLRGDV